MTALMVSNWVSTAFLGFGIWFILTTTYAAFKLRDDSIVKLVPFYFLAAAAATKYILF